MLGLSTIKMMKTSLKDQLVKNRRFLQDLIKRRYVYSLGFQIYGGSAGLYDYGPIGCAVKNNIQQIWRDHFILQQDLLQINCTCVTPEPVLQASGHVGKFTDLMVKDSKNGTPYRADKLIAQFIQKKLEKQKNKMSKQDKEKFQALLVQVDGMKAQQIKRTIQSLQVIAPQTGNSLTDPVPFNLMFKTSIGPTVDCAGYLRPQTAQGIFVNFQKLLQFSGGRIPMGVAQIGLGFRNQIAPRNGLLRVRQFQMAEIQYFVDPKDKSHRKFGQVKGTVLPLWSAKNQEVNQPLNALTIGQAVQKKIVNNQTLGYFLVKIYEFLTMCGINPQGLRFRQHQQNQMAHYASDCWDAQILTSHGWIQCVGCADRSAFDLQKHSEHSGVRLVAARKFKQAKQMQLTSLKINKGGIGKRLKKQGQKLIEYLEGSNEQRRLQMKQQLSKGSIKISLEGKQYQLVKEDVEFQTKLQNVMEEKYVPHVIEPSFGLGRILFAIMEHSFFMRDQKRTFLAFKPRVAPVKCSLLPLISNPEILAVVPKINSILKRNSISCKVDQSGQSIGRRYARTDQVGVPFAITIDFDTLKDSSVALRQQKSCMQIRVPIEKLGQILRELGQGTALWQHIASKYPRQQVDEKQ